MKNKRSKYEVVGHITVDAGIVQIGDPCYDYGKKAKWFDFCALLEKEEISGVTNLPHTHSSKGSYGDNFKAIVVQSGMGDGIYAVEVKRDPTFNVIKEVRIKFF